VIVHLVVARNCGTFSKAYILPPGMPTAFAKQSTTMIGQMPQKIRGVSYCDRQFFIAFASRADCIVAIHLDGFRQCNPQRFNQFAASGFLAIHAGYFFDPTDPAQTFLLQNCRVILFHTNALSKTMMLKEIV
jgi:hypothetical protein